MQQTLKYAACVVATAAIFVAGPALAVIGYSTAHLNLRAGPGTQYPVKGVMDFNVRSDITGCLADYSWCSVSVAGQSGWAAAEYLVVEVGGRILEIDTAGPQTGIPVVAAEGFVEVVAGPTVGVVVGAGGFVEAIVPEPAVLQYISATPVPPVALQGEIVVGAVLPAAVQLYQVPGSAHGYAVVNGHPVLVDVNTRAVVYIHR